MWPWGRRAHYISAVALAAQPLKFQLVCAGQNRTWPHSWPWRPGLRDCLTALAESLLISPLFLPVHMFLCYQSLVALWEGQLP